MPESWPSSRTSFVMLCALDIALFVGAMQMSNDLIGLLILFMYGPVGLLIGFRHGARALTMHSAAAALAIIVAISRFAFPARQPRKPTNLVRLEAQAPESLPAVEQEYAHAA